MSKHLLGVCNNRLALYTKVANTTKCQPRAHSTRSCCYDEHDVGACVVQAESQSARKPAIIHSSANDCFRMHGSLLEKQALYRDGNSVCDLGVSRILSTIVDQLNPLVLK